jgi:NAD(P)-dependent dehydrogenase (short-subunit alcohol dehydrogenase family)
MAAKSGIRGKAAFVTGGTRGIGMAISRALLTRGARVFVCGRRQSKLDAALAELRSSFGEAVQGATCDVRDPAQVKSAYKELDRFAGGIDILVNNAGVAHFNAVESLTVDEWRDQIETNLSGVFYCCREAIPRMKRRGGGYIINIGSLAGKNAFPGASAYNASKFGLVGFSEALMQEVRHDHIRVSYIMPGSVNTEFGRGKRDPGASWKLSGEDVALTVVNLLEMDPRALASRVELRPSEPKK